MLLVHDRAGERYGFFKVEQGARLATQISCLLAVISWCPSGAFQELAKKSTDSNQLWKYCLISLLSPNRPRTPLNRALGKLPVKFYHHVLLHIQDTKGEYNNPEQEELVGYVSFELFPSEIGIHRAMWLNLFGDNSSSLELYFAGEVMSKKLSFSPQIEWINKKTPKSKSNSFFVCRLD